VDVLVWNYHDADVAVPDAQVRLEIDGLQGRSVLESEFRMDTTHSNAYRVWQQMGSPLQPYAEQLNQLQNAGQLEETVRDKSVAAIDGKAAIELSLPRQGVAVVQLREQ
jgi:xylan 1,4-beta-xylosidase